MRSIRVRFRAYWLHSVIQLESAYPVSEPDSNGRYIQQHWSLSCVGEGLDSRLVFLLPRCCQFKGGSDAADRSADRGESLSGL